MGHNEDSSKKRFYITKLERSHINNLMLHMKALEKQKHQKLRVAGKRELIVKTKIRKQREKNTKTE